jgi:hypothetical protein
MTHLFPNFLADEAEYSQAEGFWARLWAEIAEEDRRCGGWRCRWFQPQAPNDGNPIFTAVSDTQRKAIRVIQYEPTSHEPELDYWFDTFGGDESDPQAIRELVIACALSPETAQKAREIMSSWVSGEFTE